MFLAAFTFSQALYFAGPRDKLRPNFWRSSVLLLAAYYATMATLRLQFLLVAEAALEASAGQGPGGFGASDGGMEEHKSDML